jgi:hypothetical protein
VFTVSVVRSYPADPVGPGSRTAIFHDHPLDRAKLLSLPPKTRVLPSHGHSTMLCSMRQTSMAVRALARFLNGPRGVERRVARGINRGINYWTRWPL